MLILGVSQFFLPAPPPPVENASKAVSQSAPATSGNAQVASLSTANAVSKPAQAKKTTDVRAASVTIETDDYIAVFSNQGAVLTSFQLKKYKNRVTQKPLEMVNPDPNRPKPFSLDYAPLPDLNQRMFEVEGGSQKLSHPGDKAKLVFRTVDRNGTILEKIFRLQNKTYLIDFEVAVSQSGNGAVGSANLAVEWADTLGREENTGTNSRTGGYRVATLSPGGLDSQRPKSSQESNEISGITWTALANQFFMAALIPDPSTGGATAKVVRDCHAYKSPSAEDPNPGDDPKIFSPRPELIFDGQALRGGERFQRRMQVFIGPQDYSLLKGLNLQLERVIDFGMFGFISVYMLALLKWFYLTIHNWGLAIIFLSVLVKLALWFPTHNSYKNMYMTQRKMKEVQPKLDALKRKYPDDKQKQQQEQMKLFQEAGINPLGGCLPMILQLPVIYALYGTLGHSIELRGASFLWLSDLTLDDPIYVLPFLVGVTMILQQKVSGQMATQTSGQQKMMMWMMPVVLTFISTKWPAGLLLYWVVTNILSMIQQKVVNREIQHAKKKVEESKS